MAPGKLLQLVALIIEREDLTDTDKLVTIVTVLWQVSYGHVSQRDLSNEMGVHFSTVKRTFRKLKEAELISIEKKSRYIWSYDFDGFLSDRDSTELGGNPMRSSVCSLTIIKAYFSPENPGKLVCSAVLIKLIVSFLFNLITWHEHTDRPVFSEKEGGSLENEHTENILKRSRRLNSCETQEENDVPIVNGPRDKLYDQIDQVLSKPSRKRKREFADGPKKVKRRLRTDDKEASEYNCNDLEVIFKRTWIDTWGKFSSSRWTLREKKHAKDMIREHGGEAIANYIRFVIEHWDDLCRRYKVNGYPSIPIIYGYRRSWFPESVNGKVVASSAGEYSGSDIQSGRWE